MTVSSSPIVLYFIITLKRVEGEKYFTYKCHNAWRISVDTATYMNWKPNHDLGFLVFLEDYAVSCYIEA